jgi:hypothetical protein
MPENNVNLRRSEINTGHAAEQRKDAALSLLKDLNGLLAQSEKYNFAFVSYLLQMAILEAEAVADEAGCQSQGGAPHAPGATETNDSSS